MGSANCSFGKCVQAMKFSDNVNAAIAETTNVLISAEKTNLQTKK